MLPSFTVGLLTHPLELNKTLDALFKRMLGSDEAGMAASDQTPI
jgi:hypothetical protein